MTIEIICEDLTGCNGYKIFDKDKNLLIRNQSKYNVHGHFSEDDINNLLTEQQYKKFEAGTYLFNVPSFRIFVISDNFRYYRYKDVIKITDFQKELGFFN